MILMMMTHVYSSLVFLHALLCLSVWEVMQSRGDAVIAEDTEGVADDDSQIR